MTKRKKHIYKGEVIEVKTRKELASEYGVSIRTLYRWIQTENIEVPRGLIKPKTLKVIYGKFGRPK